MIYTFQEIFVPKLWGGDGITRLKGHSAGSSIGESLEISGLPEATSVVSAGPEQGLTLRELICHHGAALLGRRGAERFGQEFPLLIKFISADDDLSIQVHPDDRMAVRLGHPYGKNEMWFIVDAQPGASLGVGFTAPFTDEDFLYALSGGTLPEFINHTPTHPGDCFYIPAGTIHSIGRGNLVIEIQQTSDDTFRVYDFQRVDAWGHQRELHTDLARRALNFQGVSTGRRHYTMPKEGRAMMLDTPNFTTSIGRYTQPTTLSLQAIDSFVCLIAYEGKARLTDSEGYTTELAAGHSALLPASCQRLHIEPLEGSRFSFIDTFAGA